MIVAADRLCVHQVGTAFLAGVHHQFPAFVVEDRRRDLHVQVALEQPLGIGRAVVVHQLQGLRHRILLHTDDAVAIHSVLRVPAPISRSRVHGSVRADCWAGAAPHSAACRTPGADLVGREIVRVHHVRITAAALRGVCVNHVVDKVQRVRLPIRRHELCRWRHLFAVRHVEAMEHAVPGSGVDGVLTRRVRRPDDGCRGQAAGAKDIEGPAGRWRRPGTLKVLLPDEVALLDVDRIDVIRRPGYDRNLFRAARSVHAAGDQRRKQRVHYTRLVIELDLPQKLHVLDVVRGEDFLVLLPGGPLRVAAVGEPVRAPSQDASKYQLADNQEPLHV